MPEQQMKSIWFFVGLILTSIGAVILISGIYQLIVPPATTTILADIHPNVWWGAIMTTFGAVVYYFARRNPA